MVATRRTPQQIVREENIDSRISEVLERADDIIDVDRPELSETLDVRQRTRTPDFRDLLRADLKTYLEDEVIPAVPAASGGGYIDETELRHELAKKALVGLKLSQLRDGAEVLGAPLVGARTLEEVAAVVAKALSWDPEAVAQFVLEHEEEPTENNAHGVRLYPLAEDSAPLDEIEEEVRRFTGRYIRVGVARWYVFDDVNRLPDGLKVFGKYMSYTADIDPTKDYAVLRSVPKVDNVEALIVPSEKIVEVGNVSIRAAKAAVLAATAVLRQHTLGYVPNAGSGAVPVGGQIHGSAAFLLSLLQDRLLGAGVESVNPTVARFKFDHTDSTSTEDDAPRLKAVRFEGNHILDSVAACRFIVQEGRPLANIAFRMYLSIADVSGNVRQSSFPVKIALESDHVQVITGHGSDPISSRHAHGIVVRAVQAEMTNGRPEDSTLDELISRMATLASGDEPSRAANVLSRRRQA
jgi:hypothetical protein